MKTIPKQLHIFLTALMFYTRVPVPRQMPYSDELLNRSTRYFPLIGWLVGAIAAIIFWGFYQLIPGSLAILLSMLASIFITGAFHEDGFADFCDGFGGGYSRDRILEIMKDSRLGTYGAIGLAGMLAVKFTALQAVVPASLPWLLLTGHALSRLMPVIVIYTAAYSRADASSKTKPIGKKGKWWDFLIAAVTGMASLVFVPLLYAAVILAVLLLLTFVFRRYIVRKIDGYTGDCLGALQQISEVVFYLGFVIFQNLK